MQSLATEPFKYTEKGLWTLSSINNSLQGHLLHAIPWMRKNQTISYFEPVKAVPDKCRWLMGITNYADIWPEDTKDIKDLDLSACDFLKMTREAPTTLFLQPQEVSMHLRPGVSQSFPLTISMPTDQPITDLTMDAINVPSGLKITFDSTTKGNPLLFQVRSIL